jgi:hypothetical protein
MHHPMGITPRHNISTDLWEALENLESESLGRPSRVCGCVVKSVVLVMSVFEYDI